LFWNRLPAPQFLVLRFCALFSANILAREGSQMQGWQQWLVYAVASSVLVWALLGIVRLGYQHWRR
jgi:hypothetical protein